jgi:ferredoxin-NADP reductase
MARQTFTATLARSTDLSDQTKHLEFHARELPQFDFIAGQFVSMMAPKEGREITRAYSIASPPRSDPSFDICLNRVPGGFFSNFLCDMKEGETVNFHGPHGLFTLRNPLRDSIFIATGTGIAPMRGMVQWLFADPSRNQGHEFWLVYGTRYAKDIYYREEFEELARENPNFHYIVTLSREGPEWTGERGYVQEKVRKIVTGRTDMDAYICGLNDMVSANRELFKELGWDKKSVVFERYD